MDKIFSHIGLCLLLGLLLNLYLLLPNGTSVFVGKETNLKKVAISNTRDSIDETMKCKGLNFKDKDKMMAMAITATESSFVGFFERTVENFLYKYFRSFALSLDLSIGPAQLKQKRFLNSPHLNPIELCNSIQIVSADIKKHQLLSTNFRWSEYLKDYIGASDNHIQGILYVDYVFHVYNYINEIDTKSDE